jgi:two-component system sensor histidine kinase RegB
MVSDRRHDETRSTAFFGPHRHLTSPLRINVSWFLKLRWAAVAGQLVTVFVVRVGMGIELPLGELLAVVAAAVASNAILELWFVRQVRVGRWEVWASRGEVLLGSVMVLDIFLLTALLYVSGGPTNPFAIFYLANISLAAVTLSPRWLWGLSALAIGCYAGLFLDHRPLPALGDLSAPWSDRFGAAIEGGYDPLRLLVEGKFVAFTAAVSISIYFMTRVAGELSTRDADLRHARQQQAQSEKLEALATLAAGAAHELASPLSTIAVVAKELELHLRTGAHLEDAVEESKLIRREVNRCRVILDQMAAGAGEATGEALVRLSVEELVEDSLARLRERGRIEVRFEGDSGKRVLFAPRTALVRAVRSLVRNALDASGEIEKVHLAVEEAEGGLSLRVIDHGRGMTPEVLARAGDPFFTTKEPGQGMGLGIFITRTVVERLGGSLRIESVPGRGTSACVFLPLREEKANEES